MYEDHVSDTFMNNVRLVSFTCTCMCAYVCLLYTYLYLYVWCVCIYNCVVQLHSCFAIFQQPPVQSCRSLHTLIVEYCDISDTFLRCNTFEFTGTILTFMANMSLGYLWTYQYTYLTVKYLYIYFQCMHHVFVCIYIIYIISPLRFMIYKQY